MSDPIHAALADALAERGFGVAAGYLPRGETSRLLAEAERRRAAGEFRAARVGRGAAASRQSAIRGDEICWLDGSGGSAPERALLARFERLRLLLNRELFLGLAGIESHYAHYARGAGYARHLDRFRDDDARVITLVLYLNDAWREGDGGELRLHPSSDEAEPALTLAPRGGTLVALRSEAIAHEVMPVFAPRWSVAAWMRRRAAVPSAPDDATARARPRLRRL